MTSGGEREDLDSSPSTADERIDAVCDEFEQALVKGKNPSVATYLHLVPGEERQTLKVELEAVAREYRYVRPAYPDSGQLTSDSGTASHSPPVQPDVFPSAEPSLKKDKPIRNMMSATTRRFVPRASCAGIFLVLLVAVAWGISKNRARLAAIFVTELFNAPVDRAAPMARDAVANWSAIEPRLKSQLTQLPH